MHAEQKPTGFFQNFTVQDFKYQRVEKEVATDPAFFLKKNKKDIVPNRNESFTMNSHNRD
jgi:hypothetical protein